MIEIEDIGIDSCMTARKVNAWIDDWRMSKYGSTSPNCYFDENGMPYEGEELADEYATIERVRYLLLKLSDINGKLRSNGLNYYLNINERESLKNERESVYNEFVRLCTNAKYKTAENANAATTQGVENKNIIADNKPVKLAKTWNREKTDNIFNKAISSKLMDENKKWLYSAALYGYFVSRISEECVIRRRYGDNRIVWQYFENIIPNHASLFSTAKQFASDLKRNLLPKPGYYKKVDDLFV